MKEFVNVYESEPARLVAMIFEAHVVCFYLRILLRHCWGCCDVCVFVCVCACVCVGVGVGRCLGVCMCICEYIYVHVFIANVVLLYEQIFASALMVLFQCVRVCACVYVCA